MFGTPILNQFLVIGDVIGEIKTHRTFQWNLSSVCKDLHGVFTPSLDNRCIKWKINKSKLNSFMIMIILVIISINGLSKILE